MTGLGHRKFRGNWFRRATGASHFLDVPAGGPNNVFIELSLTPCFSGVWSGAPISWTASAVSIVQNRWNGWNSTGLLAPS